MNPNRFWFGAAGLALALQLPVPRVQAQLPLGSTFTYQGQLKLNGALVDGSTDMIFTLYDRNPGGNIIGAPVTFPDDGRVIPPVDVTAGIFKVELDFGVTSFNGSRRWLEIQVRPHSIGSYTLFERQEVTVAPYALQTRGIYVDEFQRVGIGTTAPGWPLDIAANQAVVRMVSSVNTFGSVLELRNNALTPTFIGAVNFVNNAGAFRGQIAYTPNDEMQFRIGGTQSIDFRSHGLEVTGNGQTFNNATMRAINTQPNQGIAGYFESNSNYSTTFMQNSGAGELLLLKHNGSGSYINAVDADFNLMFSVDNAGVTRTRVLEIMGGSDLSERFDVSSDGLMDLAPEPGMVVCIDAENEGNLVVSRDAYDRRVAGIISGAGGVSPGMLMGQAGTAASGDQPVALTGRVYCRATTANGPITPGDLLTTSSVAGHAMRVEDHSRAQGAVLGKALGGLAQGDGLVLVLVGLQ